MNRHDDMNDTGGKKSIKTDNKASDHNFLKTDTTLKSKTAKKYATPSSATLKNSVYSEKDA